MKKDEFKDSNSSNSINTTKEYKTEDLIVYWTPSLCSHAGKCIHGLPEVFNTEKRPWINMNGAKAEEIIKAIDTCPTGALQYRLTESSKVDPAIAKGPGSIDCKSESFTNVQIKVANNGPFIVKGPVQLIDFDGKLIKESSQMVLCRCGLSKNLPFCDGSHMKKDQ